MQTETIPQDTSIVYHLVIYASQEVNNDITVDFLGSPVQVDNINAPNNHLAIGENVFTFTLNDNQVRGWNGNLHSPNIDFEGFQIISNGVNLNSIRDTNQFFLGSSNDDSAGVTQNHRDIVAIQHRDDDFESRIEVLEAAALGGTHIDAYAWRDVSRLLVNTLTIDEIVTYTCLLYTSPSPRDS